MDGEDRWNSLFPFAEPAVAFVQHSGNRNVLVAMRLTKGLDCFAQCIVALLSEVYKHVFFVKSFHAESILKKG